MHRGDLLDVVLLLVAAGYAFSGYRRGLVVSVLSFAGFVGGALLGAHFGPGLVRQFTGGGGVNGDHGLGARVGALFLVLLFALLGQTLGSYLGLLLRSRLVIRPLRAVDAGGGAVLGVVAVLVFSWVLGSVLGNAPFPPVVRQVRNSAILGAVGAALPRSLQQQFSSLGRLLQQHAFPPLFDPFGSIPSIADVPPPNAGVVPPALAASGPSIVKVVGDAPSCSRQLEGSGFVFAPDHVMTNAHVVAGVQGPHVVLPAPGAGVLAARVVLYDPDRDVAVLYVPGLSRRVLSFAGPVGGGADAVVAGYPENGPFTAVAARVAGEQSVTGPNIYQDRQVTRSVYALRAQVRPGNSGGPLLSPHGTVDGVVFAAGLDTPDTGYALTAAEVAPDVRAGAAATAAVSTQGCD